MGAQEKLALEKQFTLLVVPEKESNEFMGVPLCCPNGKMIKPYLSKFAAWDGLPELLRDKYGGGAFKILIRERIKLVFAGEISIVRLSERNHSYP